MVGDNKNLMTKVHVWDLPTRLFHWLLLTLVIIAWTTAEADSVVFRIHIFAGIGILTLIVFRFIWGFSGGAYARFADFLRPWKVVREYAIKLSMFSPPRYTGHNPLGGWMIVGLIVVLGLVVFTGLFSYHHSNPGPLAGLLGRGLGNAARGMHGVVSGLLGFMVGAHVLGVFVHKIVSGENLVKAMWTGDKEITRGTGAVSGDKVGLWRAWVALGVSLGVVWFIVQ